MSISRQRPTSAQIPSRFPVRWTRAPEPQRIGFTPTSIDNAAVDADNGSVDAEGEWIYDDDLVNDGGLKSLSDMRSPSRSGNFLRILGAMALVGVVSTIAAALLTANPGRNVTGDARPKSSEATLDGVGPFGSIASPHQFDFAQTPTDAINEASSVSDVTAAPPPAATATPLPPATTAPPPPVAAAPPPPVAAAPPPPAVTAALSPSPPASSLVAPPATAPAPASAPFPTVRGVTEKEILFGMSAPFTGSAKELGHQMKLGIETAFDTANEAGGVNGRMLKLVTTDDGYEPTRTSEAMKELYEKDQVFGIIGNVGTPTAMVALPYALEHKMLFFGAFTGADLLRRDPPDRYVFNYRASYAEETDAVVRYLIKVRRLRPGQIAVFAQQDGYGDAGFNGVAKAIRALRGGDEGTILRLNYKRNTIDVDDAVTHLRANATTIKAVVMVATYRAAARFIEKTRDLYPTMTYTNVSFVGSTALADELMLLGPHYADGVIVTQVVPAIDSYSTKILEYKSELAKYFPGETPDYVSLEGYLAASVLIEGLKRTGPQLDTEKLVDELEKLRGLDLGIGTKLSFGLTEHQGSHKVWGTRLDATGHYQAVDLQ
jgi:branched-chain amino acid transport system substrate-binding protein